jgi:hypothetical protein
MGFQWLFVNLGFCKFDGMKIRLTAFLVLTVLGVGVLAQERVVNTETAHRYFTELDFEKAAADYAILFRKNSQDARINYFYGISLIESNRDIPQAVKCLKFAALKNVSKDVFYHLGRAYQLSYEFDEAQVQFNKYMKLVGATGEFYQATQKHIDECVQGVNLRGKIFSLQILGADTSTVDRILTYYQPNREVGKVMPNREFFETGVDPDGIMFQSERGDVVIFSMKNDKNGDWDLYRMERLLDGWSDVSAVKGDVNLSSNEKYPFLHTDGVTLYFSSNRPGGLGGYDIYKATYNSDSRQFENVVNMGIPFNSPRDDFFFIPDDFNQTAWFSSNRLSGNKQVVVYTLRWDDSVIRNLVTDMNDLKEAAKLIPIAGGKKKLVRQIGGVSGKDGGDGLFQFQVTDTLIYTSFDHFHSQDALTAFRSGFSLVRQRDSLTLVMKDKRRQYGVSNMDAERNQLVNEIIVLEKRTYSLDDGIEKQYQVARRLEQEKIKELIRTGRYVSKPSTIIEPINNKSLSLNNIPGDMTLYTNDEFGRYLKEMGQIYKTLFPPEEEAFLLQADSLYVWGNALNLSSSRLLEQTMRQAPVPVVKIPKTFQTKTIEETGESLVVQAREQKANALKLYHQSLDQKYELYRKKYFSLQGEKQKETWYAPVMNNSREADAFYRGATDMVKDPLSVDMEMYEKSGTLKRKAVDAQERGLQLYCDWLKGKLVDVPVKGKENNAIKETPVRQVPKADPLVTITEDIHTVQPVDSKVTAPLGKLVFKIQIGVFRNAPDEKKLTHLKPISSEVMTESGMVKYFSGQYTSYEEASAQLTSIREKGFPGAFVVAFYNGSAIPVAKAREIEKGQ